MRSELRMTYAASPQRHEKGRQAGVIVCGTCCCTRSNESESSKIPSRFHNRTLSMALFDVPGWSVPDEPVEATPKKRRRASKQNFDKVQSATVNVEKLIEQLAASPAAENTRRELKEGKGGGVFADGDRPSKKHRRGKKTKLRQSPTPAAIPVKEDGADEEAPRKKRKKDKRKETPGEKDTVPLSSSESRPPPESRSSGSTLTSLQHGMKQSLDGARFRYVIHHDFYAGFPTVLHAFSKSRRWINEKLYKSDSAHAHAMMREDPAVFDDVRSLCFFLPVLTHANPQYHKGFRRQVESWPSNPVSHYISALSSYPLNTVIADLGCGDAALARALIPKGYAVMSFDLVADRAFVVEADIFDRLPLPGSEVDSDGNESPGQGHAQIVNVVVCALSLMGTNWPNCIREAWRTLRPEYALDLYP